MATIVDTLFGISPERYQQQQDAAADARAMQFARLDPFQQANFAVGRGANMLAGAIGGALGGQDPELQRITQRQQILGMIDPNRPESFDQAAQMALQSGDQQLAFGLRMEADKFRQQALVRQDQALKRSDDALTRQAARAKLSQEQEAFFRTIEARDIAKGAFVPEGPDQEQFVEVDFRGQPVPIRGVPASFDVSRVAPRLMQTEEGRVELEKLQKAQTLARKGQVDDLVSRIQNPDGTFNQTVINQLQRFPEGLAAITAQANVLPSLRRLGAAATPEVNPFTPFLDPTIPENVRNYANQLSKSFTSGSLDPEKVDVRVKELSDMAQRAQQFQQNQDQIKAQQEQANAFKSQGLANSQAYLLLAQSTNRLQEQNTIFQQDMKKAAADRKEEERKNKPLPAYLAKEEEVDYTTAKAATDLASDAFGFINKIKKGEIPFGVKNLITIRLRQAVGSKDPDVIAREDYDKFLTVLVNESLRLNKGTQTEGDAVRASKELQSSESPEAAASAMNRLLNINVRRTQNSADDVLRRRKNAGFPDPVRPVEVPKFDVQIINATDYNSFLKNPKFPPGTSFIDPDGVRRTKP